MTADQKLKRAVNNALYSLDSVCETDADSFYAAVYAVISAAKKYHKDVVNEEAEAAYKRSREWSIKHMQEHPECYRLITESIGTFGEDSNIVPYTPDSIKWPETK